MPRPFNIPIDQYQVHNLKKDLYNLKNFYDNIKNENISINSLTLEKGLIIGFNSSYNNRPFTEFNKHALEVSGNTLFYDKIHMMHNDNSLNMIEIRTDASNILTIDTSGALTIPVGTEDERPSESSSSLGQLRYNSTDHIFEGYTDGNWQGLGGVRSIEGKNKISAYDTSGIIFVLNTDEKIKIDNSGNMKLLGDDPSPYNEFKLDICGNVHLTGTIVSDSDRNIKDNIQQLSNSIDTIDKLHGYSYTRKDTQDKTKKHLGVIAQEVEEIYPELVIENKDTHIKSVNYNGLCAVLIECVKDLKKENQDLRSKMEDLEQKINELAKK